MPTPQTHSSSQDDLSAVIGRFHAWNASQKKTTPSSSLQGTREISYEEMLAMRKQNGRPAISAQSETLIAAVNASQRTMLNQDTPPKPDTALPETLAAQSPVPAARRPRTRSTKAECQNATSPLPAQPVHAQQFLTPVRHSFQAALSAQIASLPPAMADPSFGSLLHVSPSATPTANRSISMNVRVSPSEHAQIKAGAAEAGIPMSAYVRQCAVEIESLRERLTLAVAELKTVQHSAVVAAHTLPAALPPPPANPGKSLFAWVKELWTGKQISFVA